MDCTIRVAKTKALISFAVTAKLIWVFVFAYANSRFSHDAAHLKLHDLIDYTGSVGLVKDVTNTLTDRYYLDLAIFCG